MSSFSFSQISEKKHIKKAKQRKTRVILYWQYKAHRLHVCDYVPQSFLSTDCFSSGGFLCYLSLSRLFFFSMMCTMLSSLYTCTAHIFSVRFILFFVNIYFLNWNESGKNNLQSDKGTKKREKMRKKIFICLFCVAHRNAAWHECVKRYRQFFGKIFIG